MGVEAQTSELSTVLADFHKTKAERLAVVEEKQRKERAEAEKAKAKAEEEANRKQREDEEKAQRLKAQDEKKKAEGEKKKAEKEKNKAEERKRLLQIPVLVKDARTMLKIHEHPSEYENRTITIVNSADSRLFFHLMFMSRDADLYAYLFSFEFGGERFGNHMGILRGPLNYACLPTLGLNGRRGRKNSVSIFILRFL